ncbi:MAG: hypothetical protein M1837_001227 [Sclerophora amabilis]|nr:MAG: hypothetical protein M1837_001227 [Sclerophora amabilis]
MDAPPSYNRLYGVGRKERADKGLRGIFWWWRKDRRTQREARTGRRTNSGVEAGAGGASPAPGGEVARPLLAAVAGSPRSRKEGRADAKTIRLKAFDDAVAILKRGEEEADKVWVAAEVAEAEALLAEAGAARASRWGGVLSLESRLPGGEVARPAPVAVAPPPRSRKEGREAGQKMCLKAMEEALEALDRAEEEADRLWSEGERAEIEAGLVAEAKAAVAKVETFRRRSGRGEGEAEGQRSKEGG